MAPRWAASVPSNAPHSNSKTKGKRLALKSLTKRPKKTTKAAAASLNSSLTAATQRILAVTSFSIAKTQRHHHPSSWNLVIRNHPAAPRILAYSRNCQVSRKANSWRRKGSYSSRLRRSHCRNRAGEGRKIDGGRPKSTSMMRVFTTRSRWLWWGRWLPMIG